VCGLATPLIDAKGDTRATEATLSSHISAAQSIHYRECLCGPPSPLPRLLPLIEVKTSAHPSVERNSTTSPTRLCLCVGLRLSFICPCSILYGPMPNTISAARKVS
jgi:hypothetical protein